MCNDEKFCARSFCNFFYETANSSNTPNIKKNKESGAGFGFKISTEIIAALVVGVGIGLIVDKYLGTKPFGLIIFFIFFSVESI